MLDRLRCSFRKLIPGQRPKAKNTDLRAKYPQYNIGRGTYGDLRVRSWGEGATLTMGAFCSVASGVPPYAIVGGNPARVIRLRFDEATISRLQDLQWWAWDDAKIEKLLPLLLSDKVDAFLREAESVQKCGGLNHHEGRTST